MTIKTSLLEGGIYTLTSYNENKYQKERFLSFVKGGIKSGWGFMGSMTSHTVFYYTLFLFLYDTDYEAL